MRDDTDRSKWRFHTPADSPFFFFFFFFFSFFFLLSVFLMHSEVPKRESGRDGENRREGEKQGGRERGE